MKLLRYASKPSGKPFSFSEQESREIESLLKRYPTKRAALLPVLWIVQGRVGWVPSEAVAEVARVLDLSEAYVDGVVTFYTMYGLRPAGKYDLQFCTSISCHLNGAEDLLEHCEKKLGIGVGQTTADGKFTITEVECIAGCDRAPSMQVNDKYHEPMTPAKLDELLERLSREA